MKKKLILLNGTSSSGKSSIAKKILEFEDEPYYHIGIDMVASMIDGSQIAANINNIADFTFLFSKHILDNGFNVVLDFVFEDNYADWLNRCINIFSSYDVRFIKVSCSLDELKKREIARKDRVIGLSEYQTSHMNVVSHYDYMVDTTNNSPDECARDILQYLNSSSEGTALKSMQNEMLVIKELSLSDKTLVLELISKSDLRTEGILAVNTRYWGAFMNNALIGVIGCEYETKYGLLRSAMVDESYRNNGLAKKLFSKVIEAGKKMNLDTIYLFSTEAGDYWKRLGFCLSSVEEVVNRLPNTPQVKLFDELGWLPTEVAYKLCP